MFAFFHTNTVKRWKKNSRFFYIFLVLMSLGELAGCSSDSTVSPGQHVNEPGPGSGSYYSEGFDLLIAPDVEWVSLEDPRVEEDLRTLLERESGRSHQDLAGIEYWGASPIIAWNDNTCDLVAFYGLDPVVASRVYAILSVSQYRTLKALASIEIDRESRRPGRLQPELNPVMIKADPYETAAILGATQAVLNYLFPNSAAEVALLAEEARDALVLSGNILPMDIQVAENFGELVANQLIAERRDDGSSDADLMEELPLGEGIWAPDPFRVKPEKPGWKSVKPWLMESSDQFLPPPPFEFGTVEFDAAVAEVRQSVGSNTPGDLELVRKWADKRGTFTPPGHWNQIASELISRNSISGQKASSIFTALNMALMDSGIACWDAKFNYLVVRPWQVDSSIPALAGYPNHPSYPSGHSCFSWAAATVLAHYFPGEQVELFEMAEEASISRLKGGLHYRMDLEAGKLVGEQVGRLAAEWAILAEK